MRSRWRWAGLVPLVALAAGVGWQVTTTNASVNAQSHHVTIKDNNAITPQQGFDPAQARWEYNPDRLIVRQGEQVVFQSPPGNVHPHTVTSYVRVGPPFPPPPFTPPNNGEPTIRLGTVFDSSPPVLPPAEPDLIEPGEVWTLNTAGIPQGNYGYLCKLHPWMNGEITIVAR
jgi:plastocyanin